MSFIYSESSDVAFSIFNKQQVIHILLAAFFAQACPREVATVVGQLHVYWYFQIPFAVGTCPNEHCKCVFHILKTCRQWLCVVVQCLLTVCDDNEEALAILRQDTVFSSLCEKFKATDLTLDTCLLTANLAGKSRPRVVHKHFSVYLRS